MTPILPSGTLHRVLSRAIDAPPAPTEEVAVFGMGCFWGVERLFWELPGVVSTAAVYAGGKTPHPTYPEVCTGKTGHAECVRILFERSIVSYETLLEMFWENHDPTQYMRQKGDIGPQYRSLILTLTPEQQTKAEHSKSGYQKALTQQGYGAITTQIEALNALYYAENEHQQYLERHPHGYCSIGGLGVILPS